MLQVITATRDYTGGSLGYTPERYQGAARSAALQFHDKTTWYLIALASGRRAADLATASTAA